MRSFPSLDLDTVVEEEKSDNEATQVSLKSLTSNCHPFYKNLLFQTDLLQTPESPNETDQLHIFNGS